MHSSPCNGENITSILMNSNFIEFWCLTITRNFLTAVERLHEYVKSILKDVYCSPLNLRKFLTRLEKCGNIAIIIYRVGQFTRKYALLVFCLLLFWELSTCRKMNLLKKGK